MLVRLIFTLSECSPMNGGAMGQPSRKGGSSGGGAAPPTARGHEGDSGLTAGTDALRLACLECLEVSKQRRSSVLKIPAPSTLTGWFCRVCPRSPEAHVALSFPNMRTSDSIVSPLASTPVNPYFVDDFCCSASTNEV